VLSEQLPFPGAVDRNLRLYETPSDLAVGAGECIIDRLGADIREKGSATIALSGGSTPRSVYLQLSSTSLRERVDWSRVHFFWGDEMFGPHPVGQGSYRLADETLLKPLGVPASHIHRIRAEHSPQTAAENYEVDMRSHFGLRHGQFPEFSLFLLGLGVDGHVASLLPHAGILGEQFRYALPVFHEETRSWGITVTLPVINHSRTILVLVSGRGKAEILQAILENDTPVYPAQMLEPVHGELLWCADADAASRLDITRYM
jgi:6-phosphogluconolactonase